jgi:tetratricopeptide (TPR) repeat protein
MLNRSWIVTFGDQATGLMRERLANWFFGSIGSACRYIGSRLSRWAGVERNVAIRMTNAAIRANELGKHKLAVSYSLSAATTDPTYAQAYRPWGLAYRHGGFHDWARTVYERGLAYASGEDRFELLADLGDLEFDLGRFAAAEAAYRTAHVLQPDHEPVRLRLAEALRAQGKDEEAAAVLQQNAHRLSTED